jgi:hypothetical protein
MQCGGDYTARPARLLAPPIWRLELPDELRHPPPVLDICAACRRLTEQVGWDGLGGQESVQGGGLNGSGRMLSTVSDCLAAL